MRLLHFMAFGSLLLAGAPGAGACPWIVAPTGNVFGGFFGAAVAGGGDVNGDGHPDFLAGNFNHGRAYLFLGGPGVDEAADLVLSRPGAIDNSFGASLAMVGDVSGDGVDDFAVGASASFPWVAAEPGRAYVYFGGTDFDGSPDLILEGPPRSWFGFSLAGAGDVDGDGFGDLAVGAPGSSTTASWTGRVYLYLGGPAMDDLPDAFFDGENVADWLGYSVAGAGDVNGDGIGDLVAGAYGHDALGLETGRAYLFFGGPDLDTRPDLVMTGTRAVDYFGVAVSGAGDLNGDGFSDFMVAATVPGSAGKVHVYFGGNTIHPDSDLLIEGTEGDGRLGESLAAAGDVNRDGFDDILIGAFRGLGAEGRPGKAYLYFGRPDMDGSADRILIGQHDDDSFGGAVSVAGDVDGDEFPDLLIGASGNEAAGPARGRAYIYSGRPDAESPPRLSLSAAGLPGGIELLWSLCPADDYSRFELHRREAGGGFWDTVARWDEGFEVGKFFDGLIHPGVDYEYRVVASGAPGELISETVRIASPPAVVELRPAAPNPFSAETEIRFFMPQGGRADIDVYDVLGRVVRRFAGREFSFGENAVAWDGRDDLGRPVPSGVYLVRVKAGRGEDSRRVVRVRR